jgi:MFS family permease
VTACLAAILMWFHYLFLHIIVLLLMVASGFFRAFVSVASIAVVSKCAPPETMGENIGIFHAVVALGGIAGSLAGGAIALVVGYTAVFLTGALFGAFGVLMIGLNRGLDELDWLPRSREWREPV